jgi:hypothetical protein
VVRDYLFQIVLFLAGALIGIIGEIVKESLKKWIARILAMLLIAISLIWVGYELGQPIPTPEIAKEDAPLTDTPTLTVQPSPTNALPLPTPTFTVIPRPTPVPTSTPTYAPVPPTPQPAGIVTQVPVLGSEDDGVIWCTHSDGTHTITYDSGAYSPFPTNDGCDPKGCWKSTVFIYKNSDSDAIFAGSSKGEPQNPDLRIGWDEWLTTEAEVETKTHHAHQELLIELKADDCLTFIAIDRRDAYHWPADNRGKVILNVYSPR